MAARPKVPNEGEVPKYRVVPIRVNPGTPWLPLSPSKADAAALRALFQATADSEQQRRAMQYILEIICDRDGMSFRSGPDGVRETDFAEGRRWVGNQIVRLSKLLPQPEGKPR